MISKRKATLIVRYYRTIKDKVNYQRHIDEALFSLEANEFEIAQLILYGVDKKKIMNEEKITEYKYYKIRKRMLLSLEINLQEGVFDNVLSLIESRKPYVKAEN